MERVERAQLRSREEGGSVVEDVSRQLDLVEPGQLTVRVGDSTCPSSRDRTDDLDPSQSAGHAIITSLAPKKAPQWL